MSVASAFSRAVAPPIYRFMGIDIFKKRAWLALASQWSDERRAAWRITRLADMLEHCWKNVPFYREFWSDHGLKPRRLRQMEELTAYPVIRRDVFGEHRDRLIAENIEDIPHKADSTGGTTGAPLRYYHDLEVHALRYGFQLLGWGLAGYQFADEVFIVAGGSLMPGRQTVKNRVRSFLERKRGLSCIQMDRNLAVKCHAEICRQKAIFLHGYPSAIALLADHLQQLGLYIRGLKAIITTAEMLQPQYRRLIERAFEVSVFDHYGCNDGGLLSYECRFHNGFHYNDFESVLEVLEPDENAVGQLAITNLWNRSMPFIRYENGDLVSLGDKDCPCEFSFPIICGVQGRTADILRFQNGKSLTGPGSTLIFKEIDVQAWQIAQTGPAQLEVRLLSGRVLPEERERYIRDVLKFHLTEEIAVQIKYVDRLTTTTRGKLKPVFVENSEDLAPVEMSATSNRVL